MKTSDFDFDLPPELIAQRPAARRDGARLFVYRRREDRVEHRTVRELPEILPPESLLVLNDTKVVPARLYGKKPTGGRVEILLLRRLEPPAEFEALGTAGRGLKNGDLCKFGGPLNAMVAGRGNDGRVRLRFDDIDDLDKRLANAGVMPLPPYIRRGPDDEDDLRALDRERYQTVFARNAGAVAAPTAGLHFTADLLEALSRRGIENVCVTLHVGPGTFRPVRSEDVSEHVMDSENYEISAPSAERINHARNSGRRLVVVGTTSCRCLESAFLDGAVQSGTSTASLFIRPGYSFHATDALMTNFHLPRSTLLMLVSALVGRERLLGLYAEAVRERYRFFSYGDAMLLL
ncbi:MAG: tRNA preQ1(34) S-adenosylmethionine ribosyltransferase-isomerase QueA [Deltaproteobacteria bacterium]|nr:tRNA preQ1(34) S-adenosylmethionine ribosyltransferase-isomerase QueA [Deltaproteobacteria bacterium]